jgi:histone acetyltransferase 1
MADAQVVAFQKGSEFETALKMLPQKWSPPGQHVKDFESEGVRYGVWVGDLSDVAVKQMIKRIQILVPLLIEGGTYIGTEESDSLDRWTVFFLYRQRPVQNSPGSVTYEFAGYSTVYRFFHFQPNSVITTPSDDFELPSPGSFKLTDLPCRSRLSQFIILPPFQEKGNGFQFYRIIFDFYQRHVQTVELTVEDPNEKFDDLRDLADLEFLRNIPDFNDLRINHAVEVDKKGLLPKNIVDKDALERLRRRVKIAPRQFHRLVEMHLMSTLPKSVRPPFWNRTMEGTREEQHEYRLWTLVVKQRLYKHNQMILGQLEPTDRVNKLSETLTGVEDGYHGILERAAAYKERMKSITNGKRKLDSQDAETVSKKARVEDVEEA